MEMRCYRKILRISYEDHVTNEEAGKRTTQRPPDHHKEKQTAVVWSYSHSSGLARTILQGTAKRGKKTRQTEEEVGRHHQGMDRPGVHQVPKGSEEQGKMEETGHKIICSAPTTLAVKGEMR